MCKFMKQALLEAKKGEKLGEVPVGAVIVREGEIISKAFNTREKTQNALCHAEILAIQKACKKLHSFRLTDCSLYVTLEPCPMCTGAIVNARIGQVFVGCKDEEYGCCGGKTNLANGDFGYSPQITFGVMEEECKALLDSFFCKIRQKNKLKKLLGKTISVCHASKCSYFSIDGTDVLCITSTPPITRDYVDLKLNLKDKDICFKAKEQSMCIKDQNQSLCLQESTPQHPSFGKTKFLLGDLKDCASHLESREDKNLFTQEKVFAIIDELRTGDLIFLCKNYDKEDVKAIIKILGLQGRLKLFAIGAEPIIFDANNLTRGE